VTRRGILSALVLLFGAASLGADVVVLTNGDRVTGRVVGRITRRVRLQTPYGVLVVPADKVERILRDDGSVEVMNAPPAPAPPPPPPPPPPPSLRIGVSGNAFWHAWDPKAAPLDPSLRLQVWIDGTVAATYTDVNLDPEDLPQAVVNSFVFSPEQLLVSSADAVVASSPERFLDDVRLRIALPAELAGRRRLRLAYQVNDGSYTRPAWRDVVEATGEVALAPGWVSRVRVTQERGEMEYARRRMRGVETFLATLEAEPAEPASPESPSVESPSVP
jgi:hypothetical protein